MRIAREWTTRNARPSIIGCVIVHGLWSLETGRLWHALTTEAPATGEVLPPLATGEHVMLLKSESAT